MSAIWGVLLTAVLTAAIVLFSLALFFRLKVQPYLDAKIEELRGIAEQMEESIRQGVKKGVGDSLKDFPTATVKETTRSVVKMGSGLVEGGLSSIFGDKSK